MGDEVFINGLGGGRRLDSESSRRKLRRSGMGADIDCIKYEYCSFRQQAEAEASLYLVVF
jgi:hypothetical protein